MTTNVLAIVNHDLTFGNVWLGSPGGTSFASIIAKSDIENCIPGMESINQKYSLFLNISIMTALLKHRFKKASLLSKSINRLNPGAAPIPKN